MLYNKLRGNLPAGSGEEDFLRVFTIYGRGGHLGHVTSIMSRVGKMPAFMSKVHATGVYWDLPE